MIILFLMNNLYLGGSSFIYLMIDMKINMDTTENNKKMLEIT